MEDDTLGINDVRVAEIRELVRPVDLVTEMPMPASIAAQVRDTRTRISRILHGTEPGLLVVVGPCSIHDAAAAVEYARWATDVRRWFSGRLEIVMRVYCEKPRTQVGWKGLINDPYLDGSFRIGDGLRLARALLLEINSLHVPAATEFVDLITPQYVGDLISWAAIGARTTESQVHRELASGVSCPVGFKNGTAGDVGVAVNAVAAARVPHHFLGVTKTGAAAIIGTTGNPDCHVILRGGPSPNYDESTVAQVARALANRGACARVMIDCSHGNCRGDHQQQLAVAAEVARQVADGSPHICGLMVESNLIAGRQPIGEGALVPGQSITDPCIDLENTAALLTTVADAVGVARMARDASRSGAQMIL
jgi:3-deoxy-7-phosphoheptulonate synthase